MQLIYRREGLPDRTWPHEPRKLLSPEVIAIEKLTGMEFDEWAEAVKRGSMTALHAYLYVLLKRENPVLVPGNVVFSRDQVDLELTDKETDDVRELMLKAKDERPFAADEQRLLDHLQADWEKRHPHGETESPVDDQAGGPGLPPPTGDPGPKGTPTGSTSTDGGSTTS